MADASKIIDEAQLVAHRRRVDAQRLQLRHVRLKRKNIMALDVRRPDAPDVLAHDLKGLPGARGKQAEGAVARMPRVVDSSRRDARQSDDGLRRAGVDVAVRVGRFVARPVNWW